MRIRINVRTVVTCLGTFIAAASFLPGTVALAQAEEPSTVFRKTLQYDGVPYSLEIQRREAQYTSARKDGPDHVSLYVYYEMYMTPTNKPKQRRIVWWHRYADPGEHAITGRFVFDVCVSQQRDRPTLLLGAGNTYYHWKSIIEIDPAIECSEPPVPTEIDLGRVDDKKLQVNASDSELRRITVPPKAYSWIGGISTLRIACDDEEVRLSFEHKGVKPEALTCDFRRRVWKSEKGREFPFSTDDE